MLEPQQDRQCTADLFQSESSSLSTLAQLCTHILRCNSCPYTNFIYFKNVDLCKDFNHTYVLKVVFEPMCVVFMRLCFKVPR